MSDTNIGSAMMKNLAKINAPKFASAGRIPVHIKTAIALFILLGAGASTPCAAEVKSPTFPGGASSLKESFQDWQVSCGINNNDKQCSMSQQQRQKDSNRLVVAMEIAPAAKDGSVNGTLVLPFGLLVSSGVVFQVDDKPPGPGFAFRTCLPSGCLVPFKFDKSAVSVIRTGSVFKITATDTQEKLFTLSISLKGFSESQDRLSSILSK